MGAWWPHSWRPPRRETRDGVPLATIILLSVMGPALMETLKKQAERFGTEMISEDATAEPPSCGLRSSCPRAPLVALSGSDAEGRDQIL